MTTKQQKERLGPADLGLDLGTGADAAAFRWLVASELFSARISQDIAAAAYRELDRIGVLTPQKLADADWQELVDALGRGGYRRYDESTARELIEVGTRVRDEYGGKLTGMRKDADSRAALKRTVQQFNGIGPTGADIFVREIAPLWRL